MKLLNSYNCDYMSNDLIAIKHVDDIVRGITFPITLGIRFPTIRSIDKLKNFNGDIPQKISKELFKSELSMTNSNDVNLRVNYTVKDICRLVGCELKQDGIINVIVYLKYDDTIAKHYVKKIDSIEEKKELLNSQKVSVLEGELYFAKEYYSQTMRNKNYFDRIISHLDMFLIIHNNENLLNTVEFVHNYFKNNSRH